MTRSQIIEKLKEYFIIQELVGPAVYNRFGDNSWFVFETNTLHCLLIIREGINEPTTVNDWFWGGMYDERGFRDNTQPILKENTIDGILYLSGHPLGCAFDLKFKHTTAENAREWIKHNEDLFPCKLRLEHRKNGKPITWLHFDTKYFEANPKIYLFNV